jgi:hypothetical protein
MTPEAQAYYTKRLQESGNKITALADTVRNFPNAATQALPPPIPGPRGGVGGPRFPTRPVQTPVTPRPAQRPGAFEPLPPRFTPGQLSSAPRMTPPNPPANYTPLAAIPAAGAGAYGVYKTGEALRERGQGNPETPFPEIPIPEGPARMPEDVLRETVDRERAANAVPYSVYGEDSPRERLGENIPRLAASVMRRGEPSGSRVAPAEPSGSGVPLAAPAKTDLMSRLFGGPQYQGSGGQLLQRSGEGRTTVNWGDPDSAANFFRADAAMRKLQDEKQDFEGRSGADIDYVNRMAASQQNAKAVPEGKAEGGSVSSKPTKEAMLHRALEIIHHMITNK